MSVAARAPPKDRPRRLIPSGLRGTVHAGGALGRRRPSAAFVPPARPPSHSAAAFLFHSPMPRIMWYRPCTHSVAPTAVRPSGITHDVRPSPGILRWMNAWLAASLRCMSAIAGQPARRWRGAGLSLGPRGERGWGGGTEGAAGCGTWRSGGSSGPGGRPCCGARDRQEMAALCSCSERGRLAAAAAAGEPDGRPLPSHEP